jgi:hypothetical protein
VWASGAGLLAIEEKSLVPAGKLSSEFFVVHSTVQWRTEGGGLGGSRRRPPRDGAGGGRWGGE